MNSINWRAWLYCVCGSVTTLCAAETPDAVPPAPPAAAEVSATPGEAPSAEGSPDVTQPPAGHSLHGDSFNAGPRQAAYEMAGTGRIDFPITTNDPRAQQFFVQGIGQLHGFWYFEAERAFRQALAYDPDCAMAYWGLALANRENADRAQAFLREAVQRKSQVSANEALWIDALDHLLNPPDKQPKHETWRTFIRDLEKIVHADPQAVEPQAFLAWAIWQGAREGVPINSHEATDALLQQVIARQPDHAGVHHYTVHLWDEEKPERALWAAAGIGPAAPGIAHMWHMAGHTYDKLKRYSDAAWQQEASARVDHAYLQRDRVMPYQIHNYAHNQEWCVRSLSHIGRASDARQLARNLIELPRHPKHNRVSDGRSAAGFGRARLLELLARYELWNDALALTTTSYLEPTEDKSDQARRWHLIALAQLGTGDLPASRETLASLEAIAPPAATPPETANPTEAQPAEPPAPSSPDAAPPATSEAKPADSPEEAKQQEEEEKKRQEEEKRERERREREEKQLRETVERYAQEIKAWLALAEGRAEEALPELEKIEGLSKERLARAYLSAGKNDQAIETARAAVEGNQGDVLALATLVEVLHGAGCSAEAKEAFERLRAIGAQVELTTPPMRRLQPIAESLGFGSDWRPAYEPPADVGPRPDFDTLGPFTWQPQLASAWKLADAAGREISLADYRGKPVVVIFYLGIGCLHCVEQLEAFAPLAPEYATAGIELIGISTDGPELLRQSHERFAKSNEEGKFPFLLLSDAALSTFKQYRAYDDFEQLPLHGTFLIDGDGRVRWQDIGYEPFQDAKFLLEEAKRLLAVSPDDTGH
ncbi:MAG: redoxin domain-containing protein [Pirellulales bacterium]|nr:redoxin domain-containing protein [Pirellulales bacterium]